MAHFRKVLILDDDPVALYVHRHGVEASQLGEQIHLCLSAQQAHEHIRQLGIGRSEETDLPDLLLVDIHMPEKDGLEFLGEFYALPEEERKNVCLFVLTTSTHPSDRQRAAEFPIDGYLNKPFGERQIRQILSGMDPG